MDLNGAAVFEPGLSQSVQTVKRFFKRRKHASGKCAELILTFGLASEALFYPAVILADTFIAAKMTPLNIASGR